MTDQPTGWTPPGEPERASGGTPGWSAPGQPAGAGAPGQSPGWGAPGQQQGWNTPGQPPGQQPPIPTGGPSGPEQWGQVQPEQVARLHQPGVVPLRPLVLGDIFGGALQTMRRNPEATIGMGFIVMAVLLVPSLLLSLVLTRTLNTLPEGDLLTITTLVNGLMSMLSSIALTGMIVHVVGEAVLGDRAGLGQTWQATKGRIPALVGTVLVISVLGTLALVLAVLVLVLLLVAADGIGGGGWVLTTLGVLGFLALLVLTVWAWCRMSLAPAPVVLEKVGPWRGIVRAWKLTRGAQGWRVVGITLLAGLLVGIFSSMVQLPISFLLLLGLESATGAISTVSPLVLTVDHLLQLVVGALTIPFSAGVTALLYLDLRIRREGLDVALLRSAQERVAARGR